MPRHRVPAAGPAKVSSGGVLLHLGDQLLSCGVDGRSERKCSRICARRNHVQIESFWEGLHFFNNRFNPFCLESLSLAAWEEAERVVRGIAETPPGPAKRTKENETAETMSAVSDAVRPRCGGQQVQRDGDGPQVMHRDLLECRFLEKIRGRAESAGGQSMVGTPEKEELKEKPVSNKGLQSQRNSSIDFHRAFSCNLQRLQSSLVSRAWLPTRLAPTTKATTRHDYSS